MMLPFVLTAQKKIKLKATTELMDGWIAPYNVIQPGDTLELESAIWKLLILRNINGTESKPIIVINAPDGFADFNSTHYFGISVRKCNYLHITGSGNQEIMFGI